MYVANCYSGCCEIIGSIKSRSTMPRLFSCPIYLFYFIGNALIVVRHSMTIGVQRLGHVSMTKAQGDFYDGNPICQ